MTNLSIITFYPQKSLLRLTLAMKEIINSLSVETGALVVAILSMVLSYGICRLKLKKFKWSINLSMPFIVANLLYWSPVFFGAESSQYATWAPLFIVYWFIAGAIASILVMLFNRNKINQNQG